MADVPFKVMVSVPAPGDVQGVAPDRVSVPVCAPPFMRIEEVDEASGFMATEPATLVDPESREKVLLTLLAPLL